MTVSHVNPNGPYTTFLLLFFLIFSLPLALGLFLQVFSGQKVGHKQLCVDK